MKFKQTRLCLRVIGRMSGVEWVEPPLKLRYYCDEATGKLTENTEGRVFVVRVGVRGGVGSDYEGGVFTIELRVDEEQDYLTMRFLTAIHHNYVDPETQDVLLPSTPPSTTVEQATAHILSLLTAKYRSPVQLDVQRSVATYTPHRTISELFTTPPLIPSSWLQPYQKPPTEILHGKLYSFPLFTPQACQLILKEIDAYNESGLPAVRPNSMNNYGLVLGTIGMDGFVRGLVTARLNEVAEKLFPGVGSDLNSHHTFTIRYRVEEDKGLDMHTDDSDVTFNVCLGKEFTGAGLQFCGYMGSKDHRKSTARVKHQIGTCLVHRGNLRHGADSITSGERQNLIIWLRNSEYRRSLLHHPPPYDKEEGPPDPVCVSFTHDRDYGQYQKHTLKNVHLKGSGWCPPHGREYDGFKADEADFR